ncbi:MAG: hypothetical protein ACLFVD_03095 [Dehalococcoidia bacterium]
MIASAATYVLGFALVLAPTISRGFPWTMALLLCPALWITGLVLGRPWAVIAGLYAVIGLAVSAALSGAFYLALGAVVLVLVAWDAAGLFLWLRQAAEIRDRGRIWRGLLLVSCATASAGAVLALAFAQLELSLPFWAMVVLLLAAWGALAALRRGTGGARSADGRDSSRS